MTFKVRFTLAAASFVIGVVYAITCVSVHHWFSAINSLLLGLIVAGNVLLGFAFVKESLIFIALSIIVEMLAPCTLGETPGLDNERQIAQVELVPTLFELSVDPFNSYRLTAGQKRMAFNGSMVCHQQSLFDAQETLVEAEKAQRLGSGAALLDEAIQLFGKTRDEPRPMRCIDYYRKLHVIAPSAFLRFDQDNKKFALDSSK